MNTNQPTYRAPVQRTPLLAPFTPMEKIVVTLVSRGYEYQEIGLRLHVRPGTVQYHVRNACGKIPGDLPPICKILFWARGATIDQMTGENWAVRSPSKTDMREVHEARDGRESEDREEEARWRAKSEDGGFEPYGPDVYPAY